MFRLTTALAGMSMVVAVLPACHGQDTKEPILRRFMEEFVTITPGSGQFPKEQMLGNPAKDAPAGERPPYLATIKYSFAMAKYEVTQELYEAIMGKNPSRWKGPRNSVEMVSWDEAQEFCKKATAELRALKLLAGDETIRLPSQTEWEYCCRAGTKTHYSFGDDAAMLGDHAWFNGNAKGNDPPVGKKKPNAWGLYDMHGYVWEWCADTWHQNHELTPRSGGPWENRYTSKERVIRGGSWADDADAARSAYRRGLAAGERSDAVGFRCVKAKERDRNEP